MGASLRVLLDTCTFVWLCSAPERLSPGACQVIDIPDTELLLSDASILEISIKHALGKLILPQSPAEWSPIQLASWQINCIPLTHQIIFSSTSFPWYHRDPFDRLIIASAHHENVPVLTPDSAMSEYSVKLIW
jgi:PIN domain nuclease of toxin-antitoxin system